MVALDGLFEKIIVEIVGILFSSLLAIFIPKILRKEEKEKSAYKINPLSIAIFLTLVSVINFILNMS